MSTNLAAQGPTSSIAGKRVLIIEDELIFALDLKAELEDAGAVVVGPVGTLADAIETAERETVDAAVVDVDLHGKESYPAADILRRKGTPFLWHTGLVEREIFAKDYPEIPIVSKPSKIDELLQLIASMTAA